MRFLSRRPALRHTVPLSIALAACVLAAPAVPLAAQEAATSVAATSSEVIVTAVDGDLVTLSAGSDAGVQVGGIYAVTSGGLVRAQLRVVSASPGGSTARVFDVRDDYVVTVGDSAQFLRTEAPPAEAEPTPLPAPVLVPAPESVPQTIAPATENLRRLSLCHQPIPRCQQASVLRRTQLLS
jgi:hypothetical protein